MVAQTRRPDKWLIVNDGSTDGTPAIIDKYTPHHHWIERFDMPSHRERSFAAKANNFNTACRVANWRDYDVVGNVDADIAFEPDFLEFLLGKFAADPTLGVAGTPFVEDGGYDSAMDSFEGEFHVAGQFQLFRRECLADVGGYVPNKAGGVDWIAVMSARMKGWKVQSFPEKRFHHYRSLGTAEAGLLGASFEYGERAYYLGGSPIWHLFRSLYRMTKKPFFTGGVFLMAGYVSAAVRRTPRPVSREMIRFHRREQMRKLRAILKTTLLLKKVDSFRVATAEDRGV